MREKEGERDREKEREREREREGETYSNEKKVKDIVRIKRESERKKKINI